MKRIIPLFLVLAIVFTPLTGCRRAVGGDSNYLEYDSYYYEDVENGGNLAVGDGGAGGTSGGTTSVTSDTTTTEEYKATTIDGLPSSLANPNITLTSWYDPGTADNTTAFYWAVQKYQELYGKNSVKLITTSSDSGYKEKVVAMMAGGDVPELMEVKTQWMPTWAIENILQPVDGIVDYSKLHYQGLVNSATYGGKHYVACPNGMWSTMLWYNQSLFAKYGVKTPMEYYKGTEGWTWETFRKAAKEIKEASGGAVTGFSSENLDMLLRSQPNDLVIRNTDGTYKNNMRAAEVSNALQVMQDMIYSDKSWNPDQSSARTEFSKKKIAMSAGVIGFYQNYCKNLEYKDIEVVPLPKSSASADYYCAAYGIFWGIGAGCKNKEGAAAFMKILAKYEDTDFGKRTPLERVLTDDQLTMTRSISENAGTMVYQSIDWNPQKFWQDVTTGNLPVATAIDTYYKEVDAAIAKINK